MKFFLIFIYNFFLNKWNIKWWMSCTKYDFCTPFAPKTLSLLKCFPEISFERDRLTVLDSFQVSSPSWCPPGPSTVKCERKRWPDDAFNTMMTMQQALSTHSCQINALLHSTNHLFIIFSLLWGRWVSREYKLKRKW